MVELRVLSKFVNDFFCSNHETLDMNLMESAKKQKWIQMVCAQLILAGLGLSIFGFYEYEPRPTFWALVRLRRRFKAN